MKANILTNEELLNHWQGHRNLTRRVIEKFPENELFNYSIGGMRTFGDLVKELLSIAVPGLQGIVTNSTEGYSHNLPYTTKADLLKAWDEARSEEHTSELQSRPHLVCRLLLEKKKKKNMI